MIKFFPVINNSCLISTLKSVSRQGDSGFSRAVQTFKAYPSRHLTAHASSDRWVTVTQHNYYSVLLENGYEVLFFERMNAKTMLGLRIKFLGFVIDSERWSVYLPEEARPPPDPSSGLDPEGGF